MAISIVIIDDNTQDIKILMRLLSVAGFNQITSATRGQEGVDCVKQMKPDLVILDTLLPDMDGFETCKKIRAIKGLKTYVVMCTGVIDAVDAGKARSAGADDYIVKTSDNEPLIKAVKQFADQFRAK